MTATLSSQPVISRITLALLEDTGWYIPNYNRAYDLKWGNQQGCHFTSNSCLRWMEYVDLHNITASPFCAKPVKRCPSYNYPSNLPLNYKVHMCNIYPYKGSPKTQNPTLYSASGFKTRFLIVSFEQEAENLHEHTYAHYYQLCVYALITESETK